MTWKTNPTANRFRQTVGWQFMPPDSSCQKRLPLTNLKTFKNISFIKQWLKLKRWYLLSFQQVWEKGLQIYYITAFRMPKIKLRRKKPKHLPKVYLLDESLSTALDYNNKKVSMIRNHYKRRRKLFAFSKTYKINGLQSRNSTQWQTKFRFKQSIISASIRKVWLKFFSKQNNQQETLIGQTIATHLLKTKQLSSALSRLCKNVYGLQNAMTRKWEDVTVLKKVKHYQDVLAITASNNLPHKVIKKKPYLSISSAADNRKYVPNSLQIFTNFRKKKVKLRYLKLYSTVNKLNFSTQHYNEFNTRTLQSWKRSMMFKRKHSNIKIYIKSHKKHVGKKKRFPRLQQYITWRSKYVRIKGTRDKLVKQFLKLIRVFRRLRKAVVPAAKSAFLDRWRARKKVLYHPFAIALRAKWRAQWQKEKNEENLRYVPHWQRKVIKRRVFSFALSWYIYKLRALKKRRKRKLLLGTYRINFLFKKVLKNILKITDDGTTIIRFLQPDRLLLSTKKLRRTARRNQIVSRYRRQRMYKRILPYIAILFRYWNPQPLIEQIAFEMEKTKKHWPILRTIRAIIQNLKPAFYSGYRIAIRGKISSSKRTRAFYIRDGRLPINTYQTRMMFAFYQSNARIGSFGIKSWVYFTA